MFTGLKSLSESRIGVKDKNFEVKEREGKPLG
jgi:hypothetical protein